MAISEREFSNMAVILNKVTQTLKNFDDRLNEIEDTVTVELPKAVAETVSTAVETAVQSDNIDSGVCPDCGGTLDASGKCPTCTGSTTVPPTQLCGDGGVEEFSEKVTKTVEQLASAVNDISSRMQNLYVRMFSENTSEVSDIPNAMNNLNDDHDFVSNDDGVTKEVAGIIPTPVVPDGNFSQRYNTVKNIFNL